MNVYYNVEIQMSGKNKVTVGIMTMFEDYLGITSNDLDEREDHRAVFFFMSNMKPSEVKTLIRTILNQTASIHYVDVVYRWETEMNPDRFVIWGDGHEQEYTGRVVFTEDK